MRIIKNTLIYIFGVILITSCSDYLEKTPDAEVSSQDIFGTYEAFQGFIDANYGEVVDYINTYPTTSHNYGGETYSNLKAWSTAFKAWEGDYWYLAGMDDHAFYDHTSLYANNDFGTFGKYLSGGGGGGMWTGGWRGIRVCNLGLENIDLLTDATDEEKDLILGQIYFFRAFFHQQIIDAFGGMPYVNRILDQTNPDDMQLARLTYQTDADSIVKDYDRAIALLPVDWDKTTVGGQNPGSNYGRATKGAAMAYKAKVLLYAASPLMNKFSGQDYSYNEEYAKRAAEAGWEMIDLANKNPDVYTLSSFDEMDNMFARKDGKVPQTKETIFQRAYAGNTETGATFYKYLYQKWVPPFMSGKHCETVNQAYVDYFEMADGTRYKEVYDNNNARRWDDRDPRFRKWIIVDRDVWGYKVEETTFNLYDAARKVNLPYVIKKFWPKGVNIFDQQIDGFRMVSPRMRLAEVYLDYAEAATAAYGSTGKAPGADLTALDAINIIRRRAGMPDRSTTPAGYDTFMDAVRNERIVELCFEGHFWFDTRRWHNAHKECNECIDLSFDSGWKHFTRSVIKTKVFEDPKHYWMPIRRDQTFLYPGMYQNPGWE